MTGGKAEAHREQATCQLAVAEPHGPWLCRVQPKEGAPLTEGPFSPPSVGKEPTEAQRVGLPRPPLSTSSLQLCCSLPHHWAPHPLLYVG